MMTGYFGRPSSDLHSAKCTNVHIVKPGRKTLCGYKPHETMEFLWNSHGIVLNYVECAMCRKKYLGNLQKIIDNDKRRN